MNIKLPKDLFFEAGNRAVILFHAYTGSTVDVRRTARALQKAGYTVYAPNFTGHATGSIENVLKAGPEVWHQDSKDAFKFLHDKGYEEVAAFGLSLGGAFALRTAIDGYCPIGAGLFSSAIMESMHDSNIFKTFLGFAREEKKRKGLPEEQIEKELDAISEKVPSQLDANDHFFKGIQEDLDRLTVPFYIAESGKDELITPDSGKNLAREIHNAAVTLHTFPESTHVITIGPEFVEFQNTVIDFLNDLDWKN